MVYITKDHHFKNLTKDEDTAFLFKSNNIIIIQKTDKGNTVVVLDGVCVFEMEKLLANTSKFIKVAFNLKHKVNKEL